jgi:hypothetical protein
LATNHYPLIITVRAEQLIIGTKRKKIVHHNLPAKFTNNSDQSPPQITVIMTLQTVNHPDSFPDFPFYKAGFDLPFVHVYYHNFSLQLQSIFYFLCKMLLETLNKKIKINKKEDFICSCHALAKFSV